MALCPHANVISWNRHILQSEHQLGTHREGMGDVRRHADAAASSRIAPRELQSLSSLGSAVLDGERGSKDKGVPTRQLIAEKPSYTTQDVSRCTTVGAGVKARR